MSSASMKGRVCMVTGANSGIGKATSVRLARMGATVIMVCRDRQRGKAALADVRTESGSGSVELALADLSSLGAVRQLAADFRSSRRPLHVLDNNAGVILGNCVPTADGLESTFAINHLSHFLLTNLLLDVLKESAPSRIINVTSEGHFPGHIDFQSFRCAGGYGALRAYSQSKLAQVLFTYELARRMNHPGVTANAVHPGAIRTNWGSSGGRAFSAAMKLARLFLPGPEKGAEGPVLLASSPELEGVTGRYFSQTKETRSSEESYSEGIARRLWEASSDLCGGV